IDGLPFPTGLMAWKDGVLVCAAPDVLFVSEGREPAHGVGDPRVKRLLTGFATHNFQARVNGLRWGLDGWVYGSGGLFGGQITRERTGNSVEATGRDFRFRPDTGEFEALAGVSQQGRVRDDFGEWFGNDNSTLLWHFPLPERYRRRTAHVAHPNPQLRAPGAAVDGEPRRQPRLPDQCDPGALQRSADGESPDLGVRTRDLPRCPAGKIGRE